MASRTIKKWITINGNHVPVYEDGSIGGATSKFGERAGNKGTTGDLEPEMALRSTWDADRRIREKHQQRKEDAINYIMETEDVSEDVAKDTYEHMSVSEKRHIANEAYKSSQKEAEDWTEKGPMSLEEHEEKYSDKEKSVKEKDAEAYMNFQDKLSKEGNEAAAERKQEARQAANEANSLASMSDEQLKETAKQFGMEPSATEYGRALTEGSKKWNITHKQVAGSDMPKLIDDLKEGETIEVTSRFSTVPSRYTKTANGIEYRGSGLSDTEILTAEQAKSYIKNGVNNNVTIKSPKSTSTEKSIKIGDKEVGVSKAKGTSPKSFATANTEKYDGQKAPDFVPRVSGKGNEQVKIGDQEYHTEPLIGGYDKRHKGEYVEGHTYVPHNNLDAKSFFVDNDGGIWSSGSKYLTHNALKEQLLDAGVKASQLSGKSTEELRKMMLSMFKNGR